MTAPTGQSATPPARLESPLLGWLRGQGIDRRVADGRSVLGATYDLYHDMVVRHMASPRAAMRWLDGAGQWRELSFAELHRQCTHLAGTWLGAGVRPGATIALVVPFGPVFAVAAATALRLGLRLSFVPPSGQLYVQKRLAALAPDHIAAPAGYEPWLGAFAALLLSPGRQALTAPERSHTYHPAEPVGKLFSPLRTGLYQPVDLGAQDAYLTALRDGVAVLGLGPGDALAAPGFESLQHQPSLCFAAWLAGATYVHLTEHEVAQAPERLWDQPIDALGVTLDVRNRIRALGRRGAWRLWFKNPEQPFDGPPWCSFVTECCPDSEFCNVVIEAASGGAFLASRRRRGRDNLASLQNVDAAPGRPHALLDLVDRKRPAINDVGFFAALAGKTATGPRHAILCRSHDDEYLYAGTAEPRRTGRVYPTSDVVAVVDGLPGVDGSCVLAVPSARASFFHRFVLIVFGPRPPRAADIQQHILGLLGSDAVPDVVEPSYLAPRRTEDGQVDSEWCQSQYVTGRLHCKEEVPAFHRLAELRRLLRALA